MLHIGAVIRLVDVPGEGWNDEGEMDYLLGQTLTLTEKDFMAPVELMPGLEIGQSLAIDARKEGTSMPFWALDDEDYEVIDDSGLTELPVKNFKVEVVYALAVRDAVYRAEFLASMATENCDECLMTSECPGFIVLQRLVEDGLA